MTTWGRLTDLPLEIEGYELEGLEVTPVPDFTRLTTVIHLRGGGEEGVGEDVTYTGLDQIALQDAGPTQPLAGSHTLGSFAELIGGLDLFPSPPENDAYRRYRRWAFESAALDLALRQAGTTLPEALGREMRPVSFVVSPRVGGRLDGLRRRRELYPSVGFKLDPEQDWSDELVAELAELDAVRTVDLKGFYRGTPVDLDPDPVLYERVARAFPEAWIEDAALTEETEPVMLQFRDRLTWDAPIHEVADIEALPFPPKTINVKPSRIGGLEDLFGVYDYCEERGIGMYGGGQWELGFGRGQIQYLASLFHPGGPNDVAPRGHNMPEPTPGLPGSPLEPAPAATGFRWDG
jgi:hypothetical protein